MRTRKEKKKDAFVSKTLPLENMSLSTRACARKCPLKRSSNGFCIPARLCIFRASTHRTILCSRTIFNQGDPLERSSFGMEEPVNEPLFELSLLSCVIIPLLAFDPQLQRLGYGGGFYDRFLPRAPEALRIGIAFSEQMVDRLEPLETDIPLDYIVTDSGIHSLI